MAKEPAKDAKKTKRPTPLKRDDQAKKRNARNKAYKAEVGTAIRSYKQTLEKGDAAESGKKLNAIYSLMDKGVKKGIVKANKADRTKSRLSTTSKK